MAAAFNGHTNVVELLIAAVADLAAQNNHGYGRAPNGTAARRRIRAVCAAGQLR